MDRIRPLSATGQPFVRRSLPGGDVARYVRTSPDRGDTPAAWQCLCHAVLSPPAEVVARWAPGGSVIERVDDGRTRLTVGAWSWAGIAGNLATFDADLTDVHPAELHAACRTVARRFSTA